MGIEVVASSSSLNIESVLSNMDVSYRVVGSKRNINRIRNVAPIDEATPYDLTFCSQKGDRGLATISKTNAGVILCEKALGENLSAKAGQLLVLVENPRLSFMHLANIYSTIFVYA